MNSFKAPKATGTTTSSGWWRGRSGAMLMYAIFTAWFFICFPQHVARLCTSRRSLFNFVTVGYL
jgi:hypothetical protein